jgi:hypothetical protein
MGISSKTVFNAWIQGLKNLEKSINLMVFEGTAIKLDLHL